MSEWGEWESKLDPFYEAPSSSLGSSIVLIENNDASIYLGESVRVTNPTLEDRVVELERDVKELRRIIGDQQKMIYALVFSRASKGKTNKEEGCK